jgi:hypothetical protein
MVLRILPTGMPMGTRTRAVLLCHGEKYVETTKVLQTAAGFVNQYHHLNSICAHCMLFMC